MTRWFRKGFFSWACCACFGGSKPVLAARWVLNDWAAIGAELEIFSENENGEPGEVSLTLCRRPFNVATYHTGTTVSQRAK